MNATFFVGMFNFSYRAVLLNLDGISNEESVKLLKPAGNCINRILGHIIVSRASMVNTIVQEKIKTYAQSDQYGRKSSANSENRNLISFENLKKDFLNVHEKFVFLLNKMVPAKFTEIIRKDKSLVDDRAFLYFHEAYHIGLIGLLRRLLGYRGSIR